MKLKKYFLLILLINCFQMLFSSEKIYLADIVSYDYKGEKITSNQNTASILKDLLNDNYYNGLIEFDTAKNQKYGTVTSSLDAAKVCSQINCQYIFYGYVRKDLNSWFIELKLYNASNNNVEKIFFSADDINNYSRMIEDLSLKIYEHFKKSFVFETEDELNEIRRPLEANLPFSVSYWTPIKTDWNEVLLGVAGLNIGVEIFPPTILKVVKTHLADYSYRTELSYQFGLGKPSRYKANYHAFSLNIPILYNMYYSDGHTVKLGIGPFYELCVLSFVPKNDDAIMEVQNEIGLLLIAGYEYKMNDKWKLLLETDIRIPFLENSLSSLNVKMGCTYTLYKGVKSNEL